MSRWEGGAKNFGLDTGTLCSAIFCCATLRSGRNRKARRRTCGKTVCFSSGRNACEKRIFPASFRQFSGWLPHLLYTATVFPPVSSSALLSAGIRNRNEAKTTTEQRTILYICLRIGNCIRQCFHSRKIGIFHGRTDGHSRLKHGNIL